MARWNPRSVDEVIEDIRNDTITLPVVQRRLVWEREQITLLFDTLLKGHSFGGIVAIEEDKDTVPLFECRQFVPEATAAFQSSKRRTELPRRTFFVIDGQQRLQALYIGLQGTHTGDRLFLNLVGDPDAEFEFEFADDPARLSKYGGDKAGDPPPLWYPAADLYKKLKDSQESELTASQLIKHHAVSEPDQQERLRRNVAAFYNAIFEKTVGISTVRLNRRLPEKGNRQHVVELFKRLNQGGTRLSALEVVASTLKGFDWRIERFLDKASTAVERLRLGQDEIIKLVLILQNSYSRDIGDVGEEDADFIVSHEARLHGTLSALNKFIDASKLRHYYESASRTAIPLYFVCYHIFHKALPDDKIESVFERFDVKGDFTDIEHWCYWSLLNGVFRARGAGWTASTTGLRKISLVMKERKGQAFPALELFGVYRNHPLGLFATEAKVEYLDQFDSSFVFYLAYEREKPVRVQDIDHIHPQHLLEKRKVDPKKIHSIVNLQLLDVGTNRGLKRGRELGEFLKDVKDPEGYLKRHLIPAEERLWQSENFEEFFARREQLLVDQMRRLLPPSS